MVRMNICGLLWLSGWLGRERDAKRIAWGGNVRDAARGVNALASAMPMTSGVHPRIDG